MNKRAARFYVLIVSLIFLVQLSLVSPATMYGQGNRAQMVRSRPVESANNNSSSSQGQPSSSYRCRRICRRAYYNCLYWAGTNRGRRRVCYVRYRNCLRRCS